MLHNDCNTFAESWRTCHDVVTMSMTRILHTGTRGTIIWNVFWIPTLVRRCWKNTGSPTLVPFLLVFLFNWRTGPRLPHEIFWIATFADDVFGTSFESRRSKVAKLQEADYKFRNRPWLSSKKRGIHRHVEGIPWLLSPPPPPKTFSRLILAKADLVSRPPPLHH